MAAFFKLRHHLDAAAKKFEQTFHDIESETVAFGQSWVVFSFAERLEHFFNLIVRDADTLVYYVENQFVI